MSKFMAYFAFYCFIQYAIFTYFDIAITGHSIGGLATFASIIFIGIVFATFMESIHE